MALQLRPEAREDLDAAARWYEGQGKGLGRQFLAEVRLVFQCLQLGIVRRLGLLRLPLDQQLIEERPKPEEPAA